MILLVIVASMRFFLVASFSHSAIQVNEWKQRHHPVPRLKNYLLHQGWWSDTLDTDLAKKTREDVLQALQRAEAEKKPPVDEMWTDVYDELPPHLVEQKEELQTHLAKYAEHYPLDQHQH